MHASPHFDAARLCRHFSLGEPVTVPTPVRGGLLHRMWRLETAAGAYAVKELDREIISRPGVRDVYRATERVARAAGERELPAVAALSADGDVLCDVDDASFLVFPWCDGAPRKTNDASAADAHRVGRLLASLHAARIDGAGLMGGGAPCPTADSWPPLLDRARAAGHAWARTLGDGVLEMTRECEAGAAALPGERVVSHRDLDSKNVMWDATGAPWVIDWESAGAISPLLDLVTVALDWSGQALGAPDRARFVAVLDGYTSIAPRPPGALRDALRARLGGWLGWLHYNARRSLGDTGADDAGSQLGARESAAAALTLRRLADGIAAWSTWSD